MANRNHRTVQWGTEHRKSQLEDVGPLFALAYGIKRGNHPVFACKMCHFMFPRVFVVMDHSVTGTFEYEFYWRGMKEVWGRFAKKA